MFWWNRLWHSIQHRWTLQMTQPILVSLRLFSPCLVQYLQVDFFLLSVCSLCVSIFACVTGATDVRCMVTFLLLKLPMSCFAKLIRKSNCLNRFLLPWLSGWLSTIVIKPFIIQIFIIKWNIYRHHFLGWSSNWIFGPELVTYVNPIHAKSPELSGSLLIFNPIFWSTDLPTRSPGNLKNTAKHRYFELKQHLLFTITAIRESSYYNRNMFCLFRHITIGISSAFAVAKYVVCFVGDELPNG